MQNTQNTLNASNTQSILSRWRNPLMGIAALWIFHLHCGLLFFDGSSSGVLRGLDWFMKTDGYCGVDIFFFLSGFSLFYAMRKNPAPDDFWLRRLLRVYPVYLLMCCASAVLYGWPLKTLLGNLLFLRFWFIDVYSAFWFIPAILTLYLLFPLFDRLLARVRRPVLFTLLLCTVPSIFSILLRHGARPDLIALINKIPAFLLGALVAKVSLTRGFRVNAYRLAAAFSLLLVSGGLAYYWNRSGFEPFPGANYYPNLLLAVSICLTVAMALELLYPQKTGEIVKPKVPTPLLSFYGGISLEFYCVQIPIRDALDRLMGYPAVYAQMMDLWKTLLCFALSTGAAYLLRACVACLSARLPVMLCPKKET